MADHWKELEARRDDGQPVLFRVRDIAPRRDLDRIFVVQMPFETREMSVLPDTAAYRRLAELEERWLVPACTALGWLFVGIRIEDGSAFFYAYGNGDPQELVARLAPFDASLGFFDEPDPEWDEYDTLHGLLEAGEKKAAPKRRPKR